MAVDYANFQWKETEKGVWTRNIDEIEMAYTSLYQQWRGSGRSFFHITGHISLKIPIQNEADRPGAERDLDAALAKAWMALRSRHPTIASAVKLDPPACKYVKAYPAIIGESTWLEQTFKLVSVGQTGVQWANNDPPAPPIPTLNVITPPSPSGDEHGRAVRRDIVFRSPHDTIDGIGTLLLFNSYLQLASEALAQGDSYQVPPLDDPTVIQNLSPPFRIAAEIPPQPSDPLIKRLAELDAAEEEDAKTSRNAGAKIVTLPFRKGAVVPGVHKRVEVVLSQEETSRLTAACKSVGATVTHVFHAAIALVLRDLQAKTTAPQRVQYVGYLLRNERPSCVPPYNDGRHAVAVYHSVSSDKLVVDMTVPGEAEAVAVGGRAMTQAEAQARKEEFLRVVQQLKDFYVKVRDDPDHYRLAPLLWARSTTSPPPTKPEEALIIPPVPPPAETASATVSSMGGLDGMIAHKYGAIEVYSPWVTGEELRSSLGLFLGTFRGELSLSAAYNDAWHDHDGVQRFISRCLDVVNEGFGLP